MKKDILANYVGQFWSALMNIAFVPIYIAQIGLESFGLIGVLATLQASFSLLDFGMTPLLGRETARYLSGTHTSFSIRTLLRSIEIIALLLALFVTLLIYGASGWIANHWLGSTNFSPSSISTLLTLMGAIVGTRLLEMIYRSALLGLHRQVSLNVGLVLVSTLRGVGCVGVLIFIAPTIYAYLIWQLFCSFFAVVLFCAMTYHALPPADWPVAFSTAALRKVWRFAVGMTAISVTAVLMTQADKIILSKVLSMADFGTYTLATMAAGIPQMLGGPIVQAIQPRLTRHFAALDQVSLTAAFHTGAQIVSAVVGSASIVLIFFSQEILSVWFHNDTVSGNAVVLVSILAAGNLLNGMLLIPYISQLAYGWTGLSARWSLLTVAVQVPVLAYVAPRFGALGAAWVWVAVNAASYIPVLFMMFQRILTAERRQWLLTDLARPLCAAICVAAFAKLCLPVTQNAYLGFLYLLVTSAAVLLAASLVSPSILAALRQYFLGMGLFRDSVV